MSSHSAKIARLRPDSKGRITLGVLAKDVSSFVVTIDARNRIILEPFVEISSREQWLYKNKVAIKKVKQGIQDSAAGKVISKGHS